MITAFFKQTLIKFTRKSFFFVFSSIVCFVPFAVQADNLDTRECAIAGSALLPFMQHKPADLKLNETQIDADEVVSQDNDQYSFRGNVSLFHNDIAVASDSIVYQKPDENITAKGNVNLHSSSANFSSNKLFYRLTQGTGTLEAVKYVFPDKHAMGQAEKMIIPQENVYRLFSTHYTTCAGDDPAWQLNASQLELNNQTNIGTASDVWIEFMDVPLFYMPYMSFPLSGRKTGLLVPTFGRSSALGTTTSVPYYLNIAADADATLTLENFSDRGQRVLGEFRFLNAQDHGQVNVEYLPDDEITGQNRDYLSITHESTFFPGFSTDLEYRQVSDIDYFEDFGEQLSTVNISHLESRVAAMYRQDSWSLQGRLIEYQTLDDTIPDSARPYKVRPALSFRYASSQRNQRLKTQLRADLINFERKGRVSGTRFDVEPALSFPLEFDAGFIKPVVSYRYTQYDLEDQSLTSDEKPSRQLPVYSLDSGLFFERDIKLADQSFIQSLEPRLFYVNIPFEDQANLIVDQNNISRVFDTSLANQSFSQLFSTNRFVGADRVGDTRHLSMALTTRLLDASSGIEKFSASIGRTRFFSDRKVSLPGGQLETDDFSDIFAELRATPHSGFNVNANFQWDSNLDKAHGGRLQMQYSKPDSKILNMGYLVSRDGLGVTSKEESDVSIFWPISHNWNLIGRRNYNLLDNRIEELLGGVEYSSCCWAFRLVARRSVVGITTVNSVDQLEHDRSILFQLELKGLTAIGKDIKSLLLNDESSVSGY